jgi:hypothetical protein
VVPRVLRGIRGRWVIKVIKDRKVLRVRERKVHKVLKVPRVLVLKVLKELRVAPALRDLKEQPV